MGKQNASKTQAKVKHAFVSSKLPAFQFYPGDWLKDPNLRRCSQAARGVWIDMLCLMFESECRGVLESDNGAWTDREIAAAVGGDVKENMALIKELLRNGVARRNDRGAVYSKRMVRDEEIRQERAKAGSKGGSNRPSKTQANGQAKSGSSSSSSSSSSDLKNPSLPSHGKQPGGGRDGGVFFEDLSERIFRSDSKLLQWYRESQTGKRLPRHHEAQLLSTAIECRTAAKVKFRLAFFKKILAGEDKPAHPPRPPGDKSIIWRLNHYDEAKKILRTLGDRNGHHS